MEAEGAPPRKRSDDEGSALVGGNLLDRLSEDDRACLLAAGRERAVDAGEEVARQGSRGDCLFMIVEGELVVVRAMPGDSERQLATAKPGMVLGEVAVLDRGARSASLRATRRSVLREIDLGAFEALTLYGGDRGWRILRAVAASVHERLAATRRIEGAVPRGAPPSPGAALRWSAPPAPALAVLESLAAFEGLDARDWEAMLPHAGIAQVERGSDLVLPDASGAGAVIVLRGAVSPWLEDGSGPEVTMPTAGPGGFVEHALALGLAPEHRRWRARSPARLLRLDAALFAQGGAFAPRLLYALSRSLAATLRRSTGLAMHFRMAWVRPAAPAALRRKG
jgi:CRP-like cAMP-binding protein